MGKLIICRHGQTPYNLHKLMTGIADPDLTDLGEEQAKELGQKLTEMNIDKVYASTLSRAFNTASLALKTSDKHKHHDVEKRTEIIEQDVGLFTGRNYKKDPAITSIKRKFDRAHPKGESFEDVVARVQNFINEYLKPRLEKGEDVLIVCHSGVLRAFQYCFDHQTGAKERCFNGSIPNAEPWIVEFCDQGKVVNKYYLHEVLPHKNTPKSNKPS
jgi:2,3-bisphosphoglycerate-dependent phosphoglycerate mutase